MDVFAGGSSQSTLANDEAAQKARIRAAFDMFAKEKRGGVIQEEVSTMMRYLGAYPTEKDIIKMILPEMQEGESSTLVTYDRFEKKMLEVLYTHEYEPDTDETLIAAFRVIDTEKKGFIEAETMRKLLMTKGTPFREKEMEAAKDPLTGRFYYEDYISSVLHALDLQRP